MAAAVHCMAAGCVCRSGGVHFAAELAVNSCSRTHSLIHLFIHAVIHSAMHVSIQQIMIGPSASNVQRGEHVLLNGRMHG